MMRRLKSVYESKYLGALHVVVVKARTGIASFIFCTAIHHTSLIQPTTNAMHPLIYRLSPHIRDLVIYGLPTFVVGAHFFSKHIRSCEGPSMLPLVPEHGSWMIINPRCAHGHGVRVGDVVVASHPLNPAEGVVKRVMGLPGDYVAAGKGNIARVPSGHCWLAGDNASGSRDSRHYGPVSLALVNGKVVAFVQRNGLLLRWTSVRNGLEDLDPDVREMLKAAPSETRVK
jgi:mitochondrial inner membrane protease subunit 1